MIDILKGMEAVQILKVDFRAYSSSLLFSSGVLLVDTHTHTHTQTHRHTHTHSIALIKATLSSKLTVCFLLKGFVCLVQTFWCQCLSPYSPAVSFSAGWRLTALCWILKIKSLFKKDSTTSPFSLHFFPKLLLVHWTYTSKAGDPASPPWELTDWSAVDRGGQAGWGGGGRAVEREKWRVFFNGYRVSVFQEGQSSGDGCTTQWRYLTLLSLENVLNTLKMVQMIIFFLAVPLGIWDLSSPTWDQTHAPCSMVS